MNITEFTIHYIKPDHKYNKEKNIEEEKNRIKFKYTGNR